MEIFLKVFFFKCPVLSNFKDVVVTKGGVTIGYIQQWEQTLVAMDTLTEYSSLSLRHHVTPEASAPKLASYTPGGSTGLALTVSL